VVYGKRRAGCSPAAAANGGPKAALTSQTVPSDDGLARSDAHCRRLAGDALAAVAERGGFVVVTGAPPGARRVLLRAVTELAAARFQVVEITRAVGSHFVGPTEGASRRGAANSSAAPPLFVIDDIEQVSIEGLRAICDAAPFSPDWAAMLAVRALLITRFTPQDLAFLAPRITAYFPYGNAGDRDGRPAVRPSPSARATTDRVGRPDRNPTRASLTSATGQPTRPAFGDPVVAPDPPPAARAGAVSRDLRPFALLAYLAAIGGLAGWYLTLNAADRADRPAPAQIVTQNPALGSPPPSRGRTGDPGKAAQDSELPR
jgi:hypothetical protein